VIWVAHASRVLIAVSRRIELFFSSDIKTFSVIERTFAMARHYRQHARRVRYPDENTRLPELKRRKFALAERVMLWSS
jgi:hypothetical protein